MGALSVASGFLVMTSVAEKVSGDPAFNPGVLGGILAGALCTWIFNRVKGVRLPEYLALFSGKRLGPLASAVAGVVAGYLLGYSWPGIQGAIVGFGRWIYSAGGAGVFAYGAILRLLIPTGLHHILMQLVDTQMGGWIDPTSGKLVAGEYLRFLAGDPAAGRILSGFFITLGFAPVGAALAITHEARPDQRRRVAGLMLTGALTAMLLGVTEPVEFAFIFASPVLFGLHVLLSGLASLIAWFLDIHLAGYALPMILINWHLSKNGLLLLPLGLAFTGIYYYSFRAVIRWLRPPILGQTAEAPLQTPAETGAGPEPAIVAPGASRAPADEGAAYLDALGGPANVLGLDACMTRLRLVVRDPAAVDDGALLRLGAGRVLRPAGGGVQVVVGARAGELAEQIRAAVGVPRVPEPAPEIAPKPVSEPAPELAPEPAPEPEPNLRPTPRPAPGPAPEPAPATGRVIFCSPLTGWVLPLEQVPDPVFAERMAGDGLAINPTDGRILAPVRGRVLHVFPGGHALGIITPEGLEVLLHVGLETVSLQGEGFHITVTEGAELSPGMELGHFDMSLIASRGKSLITPILVTNPDGFSGLTRLAGEWVKAGAPLFEVTTK